MVKRFTKRMILIYNQIMKKAIPEALADGIEGAYLHPTIINLTEVKSVA